ncbi:ABC transporter permease [Paenibacillus ginsengarvi]|uniref:ABC transporter permease n=1 Tax=Paenibacillus ginsengarvi TaxID=400777 RepID=A0A3B0ANV8_9BACL|nr:ABC transporter permease [Paenibacillus ginsengarvi]RKN60836.1 hypothetical protein D7M11_35655 [Paenibacillus ginsengarvi]
MLNLVMIEIRKLKRSMFLWLIPAGTVMTAILEYGSVLYQQDHNPGSMLNWDWLVFTNFRYTTMLISPVLFALLMGYLVAKEFHEKTINTLFTYTISRVQILMAKYLVIVPVIFIFLVLGFVLTLGAGFLVDHPPLTADLLSKYVEAFLWLTLMTYAFIPIAATVSIVWKSYLASIVMGILALVCGAVFSNSPELGIVFPWSAPIVMVTGFVQTALPHSGNVDYSTGTISLAVTFLIPFIFNIFYIRRMDIDND